MAYVEKELAVANLARGAVGAGSTTDIKAAVATVAYRLYAFTVTALAATVVIIKIGSKIVWEGDLAATQEKTVILPGYVTGAKNAAITVGSSAATSVGATAYYEEV